MNKYEFKKGLKNLGLISLVIFVFFIAYNLLIFVPVINKEKQNKLYPEARTYMVCAKTVNDMYIYPLSMLFGWDSLITKPFYLIRDKLFDTGYSKFPKDEGEKELWWFSIKFEEFDKLVENNLCNWAQNKIMPGRLVNKRNKFIEWNNEIYKHLDLMAKAKIADKDFSKIQIETFNHVAYIYQYTTNILDGQIEEVMDNSLYAGLMGKVAILPPMSTIKKYEHILAIHDKLLSESKKNKTIAYEYYINKPFIWLISEVFVYNTAEQILLIKLYHNELKSNDPYVKVFTESHKILRDYYFKNQYGIPQGIRNNVGVTAINVWPFIAYKCKDNPYMKDYIQYILSMDENNGIKSIDEIKNNYLKGFKESKEYKDYDRLKQINTVGIK